MNRKISISFAAAALLTLPGVAAARQPHADAEPRVRVQSRVAVEQQRSVTRQRERRTEQDNRQQQTERISRTVGIGASGELIVSNLSGDITISRGRGNEAVIEATKVARAASAEHARELLQLVKVDFIERGNRVEVKAVYPNTSSIPPHHRRNMNVSVTYNITAPGGTRIAVRSISGDIRITDIAGEISADSTSGDVTIANAGRVSIAKSASGDVQITNSTSEMPIEAKSFSGDVVLRDIKAPRLRGESLSGDVVVTNVQSPRIDAESLSGNVEFTSPFARGGRYGLSSHAGTIRINVVDGSGFEIDANTFNGNIRTDPALGIKLADTEGGRRRRSFRAVVGDGSALLDVSTFSGNVIVSKK